MPISYQVGTLDEYLSHICEQIQLTGNPVPDRGEAVSSRR
jgi:hypothetical protein